MSSVPRLLVLLGLTCLATAASTLSGRLLSGLPRHAVWVGAGCIAVIACIGVGRVIAPVQVAGASCGSALHAIGYANGGDPGGVSPCRAAGREALGSATSLLTGSAVLSAGLLLCILRADNLCRSAEVD